MLRIAGATLLGEKPFDFVARAKAMAMVANLMLLSWCCELTWKIMTRYKQKIMCWLVVGDADHTFPCSRFGSTSTWRKEVTHVFRIIFHICRILYSIHHNVLLKFDTSAFYTSAKRYLGVLKGETSDKPPGSQHDYDILVHSASMASGEATIICRHGLSFHAILPQRMPWSCHWPKKNYF